MLATIATTATASTLNDLGILIIFPNRPFCGNGRAVSSAFAAATDAEALAELVSPPWAVGSENRRYAFCKPADLNVRGQEFAGWMSRFERCEDVARHHWRSPEHLVADRVCQRVEHGIAIQRRRAARRCPRAPTGVSGSGMLSASQRILTGASRIVGGLF